MASSLTGDAALCLHEHPRLTIWRSCNQLFPRNFRDRFQMSVHEHIHLCGPSTRRPRLHRADPPIKFNRFKPLLHCCNIQSPLRAPNAATYHLPLAYHVSILSLTLQGLLHSLPNRCPKCHYSRNNKRNRYGRVLQVPVMSAQPPAQERPPASRNYNLPHQHNKKAGS